MAGCQVQSAAVTWALGPHMVLVPLPLPATVRGGEGGRGGLALAAPASSAVLLAGYLSLSLAG